MLNTQFGQSQQFQIIRSAAPEAPQTAPEDKYKNTSNMDLVKSFGNNFDYFFDSKTGFVDQAKLREIAARALTGNPVDDNMTLLAREILNRPDVNRKLDKLNERGPHDGLIDRQNVEQLVEHYVSDDASAGKQSRAGDPSAAPSSSQFNQLQYYQPVRNIQSFSQPAMDDPIQGSGPAPYFAQLEAPTRQDTASRYNAFMQRHRVESGSDDGYGSQAFGSAAPTQMFALGRNASPQEHGMSPQSAEDYRDLKGAKDSDLAKELGNNFDYFKPNADDKITQQSLREVAGRELTGNPVDDRMTLLASEILHRPDFNRKLDSVTDSDKPDRIIGRDTVQTLET